MTVDEKTLNRWWNNLEYGNTATAYEAMGRFIADPQHTLPFLRKRLRQIAPVEEKLLHQWIADLDSDSFDKRESASRQLGQLGAVAERTLRKAQSRPTSLEMRRRIEKLLQPLELTEMWMFPEELAHVRAIQVLESIGTMDARQLLKYLAAGAGSITRTRDAQEALQRMRHRGK